MLKQELLEKLDFAKGDGLLPAIIVDAQTKDVLMQGYMTRESLNKTMEEDKCVFYSRSKERLWLKGESSENYLHVKEIFTDCDYDSLLIEAIPAGPTCHTGEYSCFYNKIYEVESNNETN